MAVPTPKKVSMGLKTANCVFTGHARKSSAYSFFMHESETPDIHKNTIMESRNATLFEHVFSYKSGKESSLVKQTLEIVKVNSQDQRRGS